MVSPLHFSLEVELLYSSLNNQLLLSQFTARVSTLVDVEFGGTGDEMLQKWMRPKIKTSRNIPLDGRDAKSHDEFLRLRRHQAKRRNGTDYVGLIAEDSEYSSGSFNGVAAVSFETFTLYRVCS